ncbi:TIGR02677 family protein [Amycolatopsis sp. NPDC004378]
MRRGGGDQQKLFKYVTVDEAPEYRAIVDVFMDAAAQYRSALSPDDVDAELRSFAPPVVLPRATLDRRLTQLHQWGNLDRDRDESWATDLQSYELQAYVYAISRAGEAAHEAVVGMEESLLRALGLQKVALLRVQALLVDLVPKLAAEPPDGASIYSLVEELHRTFKALTGNAATFLQKVNRIVNATSIQLDDYRVFKADTIHYLTEFTDHLQVVTDAVVPLLGELTGIGEERIARAFAAAAKESGERVLTPDEDFVPWAELARQHLRGVHRWFVPAPGEGGGGDELHRVVRRAVLGIGQAVERLREAQLARSSRTVDLLGLAKTFRQLPDDEDAHAVWHHRFGMNSARHLQDETVDDSVPYTRDWWAAPAPRYLVRLSATTPSDDAVRRASKLADHSSSKLFLAEAARRRREAADATESALVRLGRIRLSRIDVTLDLATLLALVVLVSRAQRAPRVPGTRRHSARSVDGRLRIELVEPADGEAAQLRSTAGLLTLPDYEIAITPVRGGDPR